MAIELNDQQARAILVESLNRKIYEPSVPEDEKTRLEDATKVIEAVQAAHNNGNRSDNVETLLYIAQCDMKPIIPETNPAQTDTVKKTLVVTDDGEVFDKDTGESLEESHIHNGLDLTTLSDSVFEALITGLDAYPNNESVEADRTAYVAEKERRANAKSQKGQDNSSGTTAQTAAAKAGEITPEGSPSTDERAGQRVETPEGPNAGADAADGGTGRQIGNTDEDAGAFARAQTPEISGEEKTKVSKSKAPVNDVERSEIEAALTLPMCRAHGIDLTKLPEIPTEQLKFIVDNPDGPPKDQKVTVNESEIEASAVSSNIKGNSVGGISTAPAPEAPAVSKTDLGINLEEEEVSNGKLSVEREKLESLITGPILKCYGRGRKEIPSIGDNELRFMLLNSDGKVSPEELARAKAMDNPESVAAVAASVPLNAKQQQEIANGEVDANGEPLTISAEEMLAERQKEQLPLTEVILPSGQKVRIVLPERIDTEAMISVPAQISPESNQISELAQDVPSPENLASPIKISEEEQKDRTIGQAATEAVGRAQPMQAPEVITNASSILPEAEPINVSNKPQQQNRAMEIIKCEGMPIPPEYSNENPPQFPMDVSIISRDELFSLHARFHAYEIRMNYVLMQYEDEMNDYIKLRNYREAVVAKFVPFMGEDGKRNTNEYREAQVRGDQEVLDLGMKEHESKKIVTDLKVLRNNYHLDCERLSRQMSKYETERVDAPR